MTDHSNVPVVTTGDWIDAAWINQYIGDNFRAIYQAYQAAGDMAYAIDADTVGRLTITNGGVLIGGASAPSWLAVPAGLGFLKHNGTAPSWFTGGSAYQLLRKNSGNSDFEWADLANLLQAVAMISGQSAEDLFVGASGTTIKRLAKGANWTLLNVNGSGVLAYGTLANLLQNSAFVASQAAEDLMVAASGSTVKRLAKGANRDILRVSGSGVLEYAPIGAWAEAKRTADLTGVSGDETTVSWDGAAGETGWKSSTRLTAPVAGDYELSANILFSTASVWRNYQSNLKINGVQISASKMWSESNYLFTGVHPGRVMTLAAGDYLEATVDNCNGEVYAGSWMQMRRVR